MRRSIACALAAASLGLPALAQAPAPNPNNVRLAGVVTAVGADSLTVKGDDGKETKVGLAPTLSVVTTRPVDIEAIKPGAFVATANTNLDAGSGKSIELRMFEPGSKLGEGSRPMAQPNTTMTNGTVSTVKKGASGRELDVAYPGGVRHIIVPPDVKVIGSFPAGRSAIKPGATVNALAVRGADGALTVSRLSVAEAKP
jgi:hypothetical protein